MNSLDDALKAAGGVTALASKLGITSQAVSQWKTNGYVPAPRVLDVERVSGVHRHYLNPKLYPDPPSQAA